MDYLPLLIGIIVIGIWFEVFAVRRHNHLVNVLKDIEGVLEFIERQTDLQTADKSQVALECFRKEFPEIADKVDEKFGRSLYLSARRLDRSSAKDYRARGNADGLRDAAALENAFFIVSSPKDIRAHLESLSKEQLKEKLDRVRSATYR